MRGEKRKIGFRGKMRVGVGRKVKRSKVKG